MIEELMNEQVNSMRKIGKESFSLEDIIKIYCKVIQNDFFDAGNLSILIIYIRNEWNFDVEQELDGGLRALINLVKTNSESDENINNVSINSMNGVEFEVLTKTLLEKMGFDVEMTKTTGDGGIDLIAYSKEAFFRGKYIIQCKRWSSTVGEPPARDLYGVVMSENANKGILITNSSFTNSAISFAKDKPIELIDGQMLQQLLEKYNIAISEVPTYEDDSLSDIYGWDEISLMKRELRNNVNNHNLRMLLIDRLQFNLYTNIKEDMGGNIDDYSRKQLLAICELLEEQLQILGNIKCSASDKNLNFLKYTSYVAQAQINLIRGDIGSSIRNLNKVFEWDEVKYTIEKDNGLDELYIFSAYNMVQLLYFLGLNSKAKSFKMKHYRIFNKFIEEAKRIIKNQQLGSYLKKEYGDRAYNLENCIYTKQFYLFEYSWIEDFSDVNNFYGEGYTDYLMHGLNAIKFDDLHNGVYSNIFALDESKLPEWQRTFNVII